MPEETAGGASGEQYRLIVESIPHLVWLARPDGATEYWNRQYRQYTGASLREVLGDGWQQVIHPDDLPPTLRAWHHSLSTGEPYYCEQRIRGADGTYRWHGTRAVPLRDGQGRIARWLGTCTDIEEHRRAERAVRASERRFRAIIEESFDAVILVAADGRRLYASPSCARVLGYPPEELLGGDSFGLVHPDDRPELARLFAGLLREPGGSEGVVHRVRHKDGSWRWLETRGTNLLDEPAVRAVVFNFRDITGQKQAEERLQQAQRQSAELLALLDTLLDKAPVGFAFVDRNLRFARVNDALASMNGIPAADHLGRAVQEIVPGVWAEVEPIYRRVLAEGTPFLNQEISGESPAAAGRVGHWLVNYYPVHARGEVLGVGVVVNDVTELKRGEEARRRLQTQRDELLRRLQLHVERMPLAYVLFDADLRVSDWNPAAERIFGYAKEEVLGMGPPFEKLLPPAARPQAEEILRRVRCGDMSAHSVNDNLTKDGRTITCEWFNTPLVGEDGRFGGMLCLARDVTERKRLEDQLRQSQKMEAIGQLAGGVAHDFNNLLTVINGYSDILLNDLPPQDPNRELVAEVKNAGERAAALTRQLLAFGRKQVLSPAVLDLNEVLSDMGKLLRRTLGEDVELVLDLQPGLSCIHADRGQMEQVILNLAVNARDAMPQGGRLVIQTKDVEPDEGHARRDSGLVAGPRVLLTVSDTGGGMTPEVKAHLFEPFFTTKGPGKGTGLGLATVYGVVSQSGGRVEVVSTPGAGASFRIYLPGVGQPGPARKPAAEVGVAPRGSETVLLVEDEEAVRAVNGRILRRGGYAVLEAGGGEEALRLAARHRGPIHLVVTDVVMPGLAGRQLAERLSALRPGMRVLYVSGYPDDAVVRHGIREGEVHFLQKPFSASALARKVREVLDAPSQAE